MKIILTLSRGQASVEKGFSINKSILVENLTETSLISQRIVLDQWRSKHFEVGKNLRKSVTSARGNYQIVLDDQRRKKVNNKNGLERKSFQEEIDIGRAKKSMLEKAVVSLSQDADKYPMDVESKVNAMEIKELIKKSSFFIKTVIEKHEQIKACKENLKELINKKENI